MLVRVGLREGAPVLQGELDEGEAVALGDPLGVQDVLL